MRGRPEAPPRLSSSSSSILQKNFAKFSIVFALTNSIREVGFVAMMFVRVPENSTASTGRGHDARESARELHDIKHAGRKGTRHKRSHCRFCHISVCMAVMAAPSTSVLIGAGLCACSKLESAGFEGRSSPVHGVPQICCASSSTSRASSGGGSRSHCRRRFVVEDIDKEEEDRIVNRRREKLSSHSFSGSLSDPSSGMLSSGTEPRRSSQLSSTLELEEAQETCNHEPDLARILLAIQNIPVKYQHKNLLLGIASGVSSSSSTGNQSPISPRSPRRKFIVQDVATGPRAQDTAAQCKAVCTSRMSLSLPVLNKLSSPLEEITRPTSWSEVPMVGQDSEDPGSDGTSPHHMRPKTSAASESPRDRSVEWAKATDPFSLKNNDLKTAIKLLQDRVQQLYVGLPLVRASS